jgi:hypothetical protein
MKFFTRRMAAVLAALLSFVLLNFARAAGPQAVDPPKCSAFLDIPLTSKNVLFRADSDKTKLDRNVYDRALARYSRWDKRWIFEHLRAALKVRVIPAEELVAALDSLTPSSVSLFDILDGLSRLHIDENKLSEDDLARLTAKLEGSLVTGEDAPAENPADYFFLQLAKKLHHLSLATLGSKTFLTVPRFYADEVTRLDGFLSALLSELNPGEELKKELFPRSLLSRPGVREAAYVLGFAWSHPLVSYAPDWKTLESARFDENYSRSVLFRLGPAISLHWLMTHAMWATALSFAVMIPAQIRGARAELANFQNFYGVLQNSPKGQQTFEENYKKYLLEIYGRKISSWQAELESEKKKLSRDPHNPELLSRVNQLQEQIAYFQEKLKP